MRTGAQDPPKTSLKEKPMEGQQIAGRDVQGIKQDVQRVAYGLTERVERLSPRTLVAGAALSVGASLLLRMLGRKHDALFVGEWAPTLLLLGLYVKSRGEFDREPGLFGRRRESEERTVM